MNISEQVNNIVRDHKKMLYALLGLAALCLIMGFTVGRISAPEVEPEQIAVHDTVFVDKPVPPAPVVEVEEVEEERALPPITAFKVSEWACAWDKWTGVIQNVQWSTNHPDLLIYELQTYDDENDEWVQNWYFESELSHGKCN